MCAPYHTGSAVGIVLPPSMVTALWLAEAGACHLYHDSFGLVPSSCGGTCTCSDYRAMVFSTHLCVWVGGSEGMCEEVCFHACSVGFVNVCCHVCCVGFVNVCCNVCCVGFVNVCCHVCCVGFVIVCCHAWWFCE